MKCFCSPYILLPSIIEQSINMNIKEAIINVLKRYQLYQTNIPQIIDKFFIENQFNIYLLIVIYYFWLIPVGYYQIHFINNSINSVILQFLVLLKLY